MRIQVAKMTIKTIVCIAFIVIALMQPLHADSNTCAGSAQFFVVLVRVGSCIRNPHMSAKLSVFQLRALFLSSVCRSLRNLGLNSHSFSFESVLCCWPAAFTNNMFRISIRWNILLRTIRQRAFWECETYLSLCQANIDINLFKYFQEFRNY